MVNQTKIPTGPLSYTPNVTEAREQLTQEIYLSMGGGMIEIELDPEHYQLAIDRAFDRYRTRSANAVEESFVFLELQPDVNEYTLPKEIIEVRRLYRRGVGGTATGGTLLDPFGLAFTQNLYMLAGITGGSGAGNLVLYDFALQYQTLIGRLFGLDLMFSWQPQSHKLTLHRRPAMQENILLWVYNYRPDNVLLADTYARQWLRDYSIAMSKMMLGEARSLYGTFIGPQGGTSLNGDALKQEAIAEMQRLEEEISKQMDGGGSIGGYGFVIG